MKKLFVLFVMVVSAMNTSAQIYVGGSFGIGNKKVEGEKATIVYKFLPEVGYNVDENFAFGATFGWEGAEDKVKTVSVNPYARYTFLHGKYINAFVDGTVGYGHVYGKGNDVDLFYGGVKPGVSVNLTGNFSFVTHIGFIGYEQESIHNRKIKSWGANFDTKNIVFGLYYNF